MTLLELAERVDPASAVLVIAFWARWETWRARHERDHERLERALAAPAPARS